MRPIKLSVKFIHLILGKLASDKISECPLNNAKVNIADFIDHRILSILPVRACKKCNIILFLKCC